MGATLLKEKAKTVTPERELSMREQFHLSRMGDIDLRDIKGLIAAKDVCSSLVALAMPGYFYSSNVDGASRGNEGQLTSTALLDHALSKITDPKLKAQWVSESMRDANKLDTRENIHERSYGIRGGAFAHVLEDYEGKLKVLTKHGGDIDALTLATKDPKVFERNIRLMDEMEMPYSDALAKRMLREGVASVPTAFQALKAGAELTNPFKTFSVDRNLAKLNKDAWRGREFATTNKLALALVISPETNDFDTLLARATKAEMNSSDLYYAAGFSRDVKSAIQKLKAYGFDINAVDADGHTGISRLVVDAISKDQMPVAHALLQIYASEGADLDKKDRSGVTTRSLYNSALKATSIPDEERAREALVAAQETIARLKRQKEEMRLPEVAPH